jgi:energy-coupling factor transporter ATP-binding protein EcfA2
VRITDVNIHRFGAVEDFRLEAAPITVICGKNESGKTTILDAILEALFSVSSRELRAQFQGIDRYKEGNVLDGNVCIERHGVTLTYPSATGDTLDRLAGFPPVYVRNLLVVRESDLQFYDKYGSWWLEIKDHLSGFEGGLDAVSQAVHEEVGLTETGDWVNKKGRRIGEEVSNLRETANRLQALQKDVEELAQLRSKLKQLSLEREVAQKQLVLLKRTHRKEQLETATVLRRKLTEEREHAAKLASYGESAHADWRKLESGLKTAQERIASLGRQKNSHIARINEMEKEAARWEKEARNWTRKQAEIVPEVETGLHEVKEAYERERKLFSHQKFLIVMTILLASVAPLLAVVAFFRKPGWWLPAITCAGGAAVCGGLWLRRRRLSRKLAVAKSALLDKFHTFGEQAASVDDVESWVFTAHQTSEQARASADTLLREAEKERSELELVNVKLEDKKREADRLAPQLESLKKETGCETIEQFEARISERTHAEDEVKSLGEKINILLECTAQDEWDEKLSELDQYQDVQILWDEETQARLEHELPELTAREKVVRERTLAIQKSLLEVGVSSPEDAWHMQEDVARRLLTYELDRRAAEIALRVLEELSGQQDMIINTVLESGSDSATHYFRQVTEGRYNNIFWRNNELYVQTPSGNTLDMEALSTGARAQLHFSLRVSLLQHLFAGEPLFLLLDDPFLTSDRERIRKELEMLVDFSHRGWQIFYFTVDEQVAERLEILDPENVAVKNLPRLDV